MKKLLEPISFKTIFQVMYKPSLQFYELLIPAAQRFEEYPHWETNKLHIVLKDFDKRCSLIIRHDLFAYQQDSSDVEMEKTHIQRSLSELVPALQLEYFIRFGYRRQYLIAVDMPFEALVSILNVKLFSQDDRLRSIMPTQVEDLKYRIDSAETPYKYHFTIGPVRKDEVPQYVTFNQKHHLHPEKPDEEYRKILNGYPDVAVFIDIDLYQVADKLQTDEGFSFVNMARDRVHNLAKKLGDFLFMEKL